MKACSTKVSMDAELQLQTGPRGAAPRRRASGRRTCVVAGLSMLLELGCFKQQPTDERPPSAPDAPARAELPAEPVLLPPRGAEVSPPAAVSSEQKRKAPADAKGEAERSSSGAVPRAAASAPMSPQKPAAKARSSARAEGAANEDRAIGGALSPAEPEAPAQLRERLDRAYRANTPDCPAARDRKKAVCDLASQICQLIDRDPNVASVAEYCAEAKERCTEAERRTAQRCGD
jgi:hypothetical protein